MTAARLDASGEAQIIAQIVRNRGAMSDAAVSQLRRLLGNRLASRTPGDLRLGHLRLLLELVLSGQHEYVTVRTYEHERAIRAAHDDDYPAEKTLREAYGHWLAVTGAAERFLRGPARGRPPRLPSDAMTDKSYTGEEILDAITRCFRDLDDWPTEWEFEEYGRQRRLGARVDPRMPPIARIRRAYGSYEDARALAIRRFEPTAK